MEQIRYHWFWLAGLLFVLSGQEIWEWGPLHDRQICWKVHAFLVQCPLLVLPHIGAPETMRLYRFRVL